MGQARVAINEDFATVQRIGKKLLPAASSRSSVCRWQRPATRNPSLRVQAASGRGLTALTGNAMTLDAHDLPCLALEHLVQGAFEELSIGPRDVKAEGVIASGHDLAPHFERRGADELQQ